MDEYHIAKEAIEDGFETIVASGGDSTVSNIAEAILSFRPELRFGVIPSGTGNDYATGNGLTRSISAAVDVLKAGKTASRDVIRIGDRYAVSLVGFGFDITMSEIHLNNKTLKGPALYLYAILVAIFRHKGYRFRVETEEGEVFEGPAMMINLGNNRISGGGYPTCPRADMTDGKLDLLFIEDCPPRTRLKLLQLVKRSAHLDYPIVHYVQTASVVMECERPMAFHTEGEMFYTEETRLEARVLPGRLTLIVP